MLTTLQNLTFWNAITSFFLGIVWIAVGIIIGKWSAEVSRRFDLTICFKLYKFKYRFNPFNFVGSVMFYSGLCMVGLSILLGLYRTIAWIFPGIN